MDFSKFFIEIFSDLSIWFLVFLLVSFIIGLLAGLWARMGVMKRLRIDLNAALADKQRMVREHQEAIEGDTLSQAELARTRSELESLRASSLDFEFQKESLTNQASTMKRELATQKELSRTLDEQVSALKIALGDSQAQVSSLPDLSTLDDLSTVREELDKAHDELAFLRVQLEDSRSENSELQVQVKALSLPSETAQKQEMKPDVVATSEDVEGDSSDIESGEIPADAEVDFLNYPIDGADGFDETMIKARAAVGNFEAYHHDAPLDFFEEDRELAERSLESDLMGADEPLSSARGMDSVDEPKIYVEDQDVVDQAFADADVLLNKGEEVEEEAVVENQDLVVEELVVGEIEEDDAMAPAEGLEEETPALPEMDEPISTELPEMEIQDTPKTQEEVAEGEKETQLMHLIRTRLPVAGEGAKDDLKLIGGIGPKLEKTLNGMGIFTYEQVSLFDDDILDLLPDVIGFYAGRARNEDWMSQAAELMEEE